MRCFNCGNELEDGAKFCTFCGTAQAQAQPVNNTVQEQPKVQEQPQVQVQPQEQPQIQAQPVYTAQQPGYTQQPAYTAQQPAYTAQPQLSYNAPALQLPTERGLLKFIFLSLITFGIYGVVILIRISEEINIVASRADGQRTMHYMLMMMLTPITLGIYPIVWQHTLCNRIGAELRRRGYNYKFGAGTFWGWGVFGSLILIGPFIYFHKYFKSMNLINRSYNIYG